MMTYKIVLGATLLVTALIAGLFYAWSCSVNPGLHRLADVEYIRAMQQLNRAIINPVFMASFMGTLIMMPICTFVVYKHTGTSITFWLILAAALLYIIGSFGVTMGGNVPLNDALDKFDVQSATMQEIRAFRIQFEMPWNRLHTVRTIANILSLLFAIGAALFK